MLHTVEDDIRLCKEFKITPAQLMFVKMLVKDPTLDDSDWKRKSYKLSLEYQNTTKGLKAEELADLIARDIIIDLNSYGKCLYDYYEINPEFANRFSLKIYPMPMQLFDRYPSEFKGSDGRLFVGRTASAEEIAKEYLRAINNNSEEHKTILEDLDWAVKHGYLQVGLKKFVYNRYWLVIRNHRLKNKTRKNDVKIL